MTSPSSPIPVRLPDELRKELDVLAESSSASQVLRDGLSRLSRLRTPREQPLYARMIDEADVDDVIERAVSAACDVLDELFPDAPKESRGIGSNFQGVLGDHIRAMLTGLEARHSNHSTYLNALLGRWDSFGRLPNAAHSARIGYTVAKPGERHDQPALFLNAGSMVPLEKLSPGDLYTSVEACAQAAMRWMHGRDISPRDEGLRMCAIEITSEGPLKLVQVA